MIKEKRLAVVLTHPVQYYSTLFQQLARSCVLKVFYTAGKEGSEIKYDKGFQKEFKWDIPLLDGYKYSFLQNTAAEPDHNMFFGVKNIDLISSLEHFAPNAILFFGWSFHSHLKAIRYFKGKVPVWFRGDSTLLDHQNWFRKSLRWFSLTWIYSHVDKAFYVGTANKAYFNRYGLKDEQLVFAPHAIDNERFSIDRSTERLIIREKLGIKENQVMILFAGKFEEKKNPILLLNAFLDLKLSNVHLLFVGNGLLEEQLKSIVKKTNGINEVHFMDFQNQSLMPAIYQSCELFCLPSAGPAETWGLAVNEAMAASKAILVSDKVGSGKDLVFNGKNGYIFESGNIDDLKKKILASTCNIPFLNKMGQASLQIINKCNYNTTIKVLLQEL